MPERITAFAPGRLNLIGEHTDYNDGLALPFAITTGVTVHASALAGAELRVLAADLGSRDRFELPTPARVTGWRAFARGIAAELGDAGVVVAGASLQIAGTVPRGSGLSSSAALEVALCLAMLGISGAPAPDAVTLARLCSRVENDWVGAQTGLLDQLASLCGMPGHALLIDFRSLEVTPVALELDGCRLVTLDSGQRHANAGSGEAASGGYNERRAECARACELLGVRSLRDATLEAARRLPRPWRDRAVHVIEENERVLETVAALRDGRLGRVGELLDASHASLRDCFAVSTPAVEATVDRLRAAGAIGARIVGGGFGGHVLALMPPGATPPDGAVAVAPGPGAHLLD